MYWKLSYFKTQNCLPLEKLLSEPEVLRKILWITFKYFLNNAKQTRGSDHCGSVVEYSLMVRVPGLKSARGQKISCYACCAVGQLLSFAPLHSTQVN